ncbi:MAG: hypothetical protein AAB657_01495 [Patescibacteria group bacterium]
MKSSFNILFFILIITVVTLLFWGCKKEDSSTGPGPSDDNTPTNGIVVVLNSTPTGSDIDIDGVSTNQKTPFTVTWDNSKVGPHRFRIYNTIDRKTIDTSFYVFADKKYTINSNHYLLWGSSWSGNMFLGDAGTYASDIFTWRELTDTVVVPLTLNARVTIYFTDQRCYSTNKAYFRLGNKSFDIVSSPVVFSTNDVLPRGLKGVPSIYGYYQTTCIPGYANCCYNGITITNVIMDTF